MPSPSSTKTKNIPNFMKLIFQWGWFVCFVKTVETINKIVSYCDKHYEGNQEIMT